MCVNFIDLNAATREEKYGMKDMWELLDLWEGATLGTLIDLKACYHNIPVDPTSVPYLGVAT